MKLFAIASERLINNSWVPEIIHTHAIDAANAKYIFLQDPAHRKHKIVAIGVVIGYHVEDEHGEVLRV